MFTYATTKRDLLFLVSNDLLDEARHLAEASFQRNRSIQHNFVAFCAVFYKVLHAQPELSKLVFCELLFYDSGIHSVRALANRARTLKSIEALVVNAQESGEIRLPESPEFIAWLLFSVFQAENRRWLALERRDLVEGAVPSVVLGRHGAKRDFGQAGSQKPAGAVLRGIIEELS